MVLAITPLEKIERHLYSAEVLARFVKVLDQRAKPYIESVMIAVEANPDLQDCTPESIGIAALRAASLQLSCDPAVKQAHIVPYENSKKDERGNWYKVKEAEFQPHYLGLYTLAVRTNKYSVINVTPFPAGYRMELDLASGDFVIVNEEGKPVVFAPKVRPEDAGAWYGYLRTTRGFVKKIWMTKAEIHAHAQKFSRSYQSKKSKWQDPKHIHTMEMKTVLLALLNWADKSGFGDATLREALEASEEILEADATDVQEEQPTPEPVAETEIVGEQTPISPLLQALIEKSQKDPVSAFWEVLKVAGLDKQAGNSILSETPGENGNRFKAAFDKVAEQYRELI